MWISLAPQRWSLGLQLGPAQSEAPSISDFWASGFSLALHYLLMFSQRIRSGSPLPQRWGPYGAWSSIFSRDKLVSLIVTVFNDPKTSNGKSRVSGRHGWSLYWRGLLCLTCRRLSESHTMGSQPSGPWSRIPTEWILQGLICLCTQSCTLWFSAQHSEGGESFLLTRGIYPEVFWQLHLFKDYLLIFTTNKRKLTHTRKERKLTFYNLRVSPRE